MTDNLTTCPKCKVQDSCYIVPVNEFHTLSEEEKENTRFKGKMYKSDSKTLENFGQDGYFDACDYIGLFDINN